MGTKRRDARDRRPGPVDLSWDAHCFERLKKDRTRCAEDTPEKELPLHAGDHQLRASGAAAGTGCIGGAAEERRKNAASDGGLTLCRGAVRGEGSLCHGGRDRYACGPCPAQEARRSGLWLSDIAVLYRTQRPGRAALIQGLFQKEGIPYVAPGKDDTLAHRAACARACVFSCFVQPKDAVSLRTVRRRGSRAGSNGKNNRSL